LKQKAYFYRPSSLREDVVQRTVSDVVDKLFAGSAGSLVMTLVESKQLSTEELARLRAMLDEAGDDE
jgi:predicted transcriptional regulator